MIYLGLSLSEKQKAVAYYAACHNIHKIWTIGEPLNLDNEDVTSWRNVIEYDYYNRLRTAIRQDDLIVINEILHTSKRADLGYNCIRQYVVQTPHRLIFQTYPFHNEESDLAILYDFLQINPFLNTPWPDIDISQYIARCKMPPITMTIEPVTLTEAQVQRYEIAKKKIFDKLIGSPATLPKACLRESQKINPLGDNKAIFKPDGHYYESQLGVDHYYCDILRQKAAIVRRYNEQF